MFPSVTHTRGAVGCSSSHGGIVLEPLYGTYVIGMAFESAGNCCKLGGHTSIQRQGSGSSSSPQERCSAASARATGRSSSGGGLTPQVCRTLGLPRQAAAIGPANSHGGYRTTSG